MAEAMEGLLEDLLSLTKQLERALMNISDEDTGDNWLEMLDERQRVMDQISEQVKRGYVISPEQKESFIAPAYAIDQQLVSLLQERKNDVQSQISRMNSLKKAKSLYSPGGMSAYGAFFDKRK